MPPEQVRRLRSTSNRSALTSISGKSLHEARQVLPVDRAAVAVQQPGPGQQMGAGAERAEHRARPVGAAQPGEQLAIAICSAPSPLQSISVGGGGRAAIATSARLWSVVTRQPLLARTGPPALRPICQRRGRARPSGWRCGAARSPRRTRSSRIAAASRKRSGRGRCGPGPAGPLLAARCPLPRLIAVRFRDCAEPMSQSRLGANIASPGERCRPRDSRCRQAAAGARTLLSAHQPDAMNLSRGRSAA